MSKVKPIPEGFHTITPHLVVKGGKEAMAWYGRAFGAVEMWCNTMEGTDHVMNACMMIGDSPVMLNDEFPDHGCLGPGETTPVTIHLYVEDVDSAFERATKAGAEVVFPLADQFWGDRYGIVKDPFGHTWSLGTHIEDVPPEEMAERSKQAFATEG